MNTEQVILVDHRDNEIGTAEKMEAHLQGLLHRAFSVFIFNSKGELLLQQRALIKYHSPGLWTNTCCSHPKPGEDTISAAHRRLQEEMGLSCDLQLAFSFVYKAELDQGLTEHEFDHVFIGKTDLLPETNPEEVMAHRYISTDQLNEWMEKDQRQFTAWFKICWPTVKEHLPYN